MKWIRAILIGITGLSIVLLAITSLMPSRVMTSRWVMMAEQPQAVIDRIGNLSGWKDWNLLLQGATEVRVEASKDRNNKQILSWKDARGLSNEVEVVGQGDKGIVTRMTLGSNRPIESGFSIERRRTDSTQVVWYIMEDLRWYPWEKFYGMMAEKMKAPLMEASLAQLKENSSIGH
jgi:hypothetical protein